jgi:hypothetical protein
MMVNNGSDEIYPLWSSRQPKFIRPAVRREGDFLGGTGSTCDWNTQSLPAFRGVRHP